jgi:hypothetical protein
MSISKAQAALLADDFLDTLGSQETLLPRELYSEIIQIAGDVVEQMQKNLIRGNHNASGRLSESISISEPEVNGALIRVDILMLKYGDYINKGVRGTRGGEGKYQFKKEHPSIEMLENLKDSITSAQVKIKNTNTQKTISRNELKNAKIAELDKVYAVARKILLYGIRPNGFLDNAVVTVNNRIGPRLGAALAVDVSDSIAKTKN